MMLITETNENELFVVTTEKQAILHEVISSVLSIGKEELKLSEKFDCSVRFFILIW